MEKTCAQCGATYETRETRRKFCSQKCFHDSMRNPDARYHPQTRKCKVCGNEFVFKWQGTPQHKGIYCSHKCSSIGRKGQVPDQLGEKHWNWKGGRHVRRRDGYVTIGIRDETTGKRRQVLEHRHVMEQHLGRALSADETVHHLNGDKSDNRLENLELRVGRHGRGATEKHCKTCMCFACESDLLAWAREIIALYEGKV